MATSAQYTSTPGYSTTTATTADTSYTSPTNIVTILTGPSTAAGSGVGYRISRAFAAVKGNSSAGLLRIFTSSDNGTTKQFVAEYSVPAVTTSSTTPAATLAIPILEGLTIPGATGGNPFLVYATTSITQNIAIHIYYGAL